MLVAGLDIATHVSSNKDRAGIRGSRRFHLSYDQYSHSTNEVQGTRRDRF